MASADDDDAPRARSGRIAARPLSLAALLVLAVAVLAIGAARWLDTESGRAFIIRQLPLIAPKSGLTIRAGRIEGSIFGAAVIHDLQVGDPAGAFVTAPRVEIDWRPLDLITNRITIRSAHAADITLLRLPKFNPTGDNRILPDQDIVIGSLKVDRLTLAAPVAGQPHLVSVAGDADIRSGRAKIDLDVASRDRIGGDRLRLKLDAEPDGDRFDLAGEIDAPLGGAIAGLAGLKAPLLASISGSGRWQVWAGKLLARYGDAPLADLALTSRDGHFTARGLAEPGLLLKGAGMRLASPAVRVDAAATLANRIGDLRLGLADPALVADLNIRVDFRDESIVAGDVTARLLQPEALYRRISGQNVRLSARLAGKLGAPLIDYRLTAGRAAWGRTTVADLRAAGIIRLGDRPLTIPVAASASAITGVGETAAALLTNVRIEGPLAFRQGQLVSNTLVVRSSRLSGRGTMVVGLDDGDFVFTVSGQLPRYAISGFGSVDIAADLRAVPDTRGARVTGRMTARTTRLESASVADLLGGLPLIAADIDVAGDLSLAFRNARLTAPGLTLTAAGTRTPEGVLRLAGDGVSRAYGPLTVALAGPLERPVIDLALARPGLGVGLKSVVAHIEPVTSGWSITGHGGSSFGAAEARVTIRSAQGPVAIDVAEARLGGFNAHGNLVETAAGPFAGRLAVAGRGLDGSATLSAEGAIQRADIAMAAKDAAFPFDTPVTIGEGRVALVVRLPASGPSIVGDFVLANAQRDGLIVDNARGKIDWRDGRGTATFTVAGQTAAPFALNATAGFTPDRIEVKASGSFDGRPVRLDPAAVVTRSGDGWQLAPVTLVTSDGSATVSGRYGKTLAIKAELKNAGLSQVGAFFPSLTLGGRVSGTIDVDLPPGGNPRGSASLRVNGLSRAGLAASSSPIDLGINIGMGNDGIGARAVIVRGGAVEGRAQAHVGPIASGGETLLARLLASPLAAQLRYAGPAQAVWGLAGIEGLDVRGPLVLVANAGGRLGDPTLAGTISAKGARIEQATLGAVIDQATVEGRFTASRLELTSFSGTAGKGGTITGTGTVGLSAEESFPLDIRLQLKNATLLNRDELTATGTGPVRVATDQFGGVVSGTLVIDRATYRAGGAATAEVPVLAVSEKNTHLLKRRPTTYVRPTRWLLNVAVSADRRLFVEGLGLNSEWRGALKVGGAATAPELRGRVQLQRGDYEFSGKRFELTRGDVRFVGQYPPDPILDITAENTSSSFTAQLAISGTGQRPQIKFSSTPSLPEDEVLSRVLFGDSVTNLSAPEALQLAAALNGLRGGGSGFNPMNSIKKGLGIDRLRILGADPTIGRKTAVAAGQYIGKSVYVEVATDAQGYTATNFEVGLTRSLSILSQVATLGGSSVSLRWKKDY